MRMVIAHAPENSGCAFATAPTDCDFIPMSMPDPPAVMPDEDFIHLRERYHQLPVDLDVRVAWADRSEEHTSELQSLMRISYAVFCLKKKIATSTYLPPTIGSKKS